MRVIIIRRLLPSSVLGQALIRMPIHESSRSGSTMTANGDMMLFGDYGGNEQGEGLASVVDPDMAVCRFIISSHY